MKIIVILENDEKYEIDINSLNPKQIEILSHILNIPNMAKE